MENPSGDAKRQRGKTRKGKGKKQKTGETSPKTKDEDRKLNQDLLDQVSGSTPKPKRYAKWKLEDNYIDVGDLYTTIRGYELFLFHYHRREKPKPICNPWQLGVGKLVVPNVFVNIDLLELLELNFNPNKREFM